MRTIKFSTFWDKWAHFQDKQKEAERAVQNYDYVFYGGAAGPGKSYFLRHFPVKFLYKCYSKLGLRGVRVGLFCEDYPALHERHLSKLLYEFPSWLGTYKVQQHEFILAEQLGGGVIAFRNLDDPSKYLSSEFALIEVDELTKNKKETFDFLRLRLRWPGIERPKFIGASNPGGIGHGWVKDIWMDRRFPPEETLQDQFHLVRALPQDNKYLPESYYKTLSALPEKLRKAYRDGNWDVFEGQYFTEWDRTKHEIKPFMIPAHWKRYRAYDHGRTAPAVCKWYADDEFGRVFVYRELYEKGRNVDEIAALINKLSEGEIYEYSVADPSIFANMGFVDKSGGQTIAETFARYGIMWAPASNRRVDGWNLMHQYLYWDEQKDPKLVYFNTCFNSIRTIPSLVHDELHPEDLDTDGEDHAADCDRYLLMALHETKAKTPLTEIERKLKENQNRDRVTASTLKDFYGA